MIGAADKVSLGAWLVLREPLMAELAATSGYDYVCVDLQHGLAGMRDAAAILQAMARSPAVPIVRVPANDASLIGKVLDLGARAVIVPLVEDAADARRAVAACRYPPSGRRSVGPTAALVRYGPGYVGTANDEVTCIPMIETRAAVENLEEILSVPGVDTVYVGPADLSLTLGLPPRLDHDDPAFASALDRILEACSRHGVVPGIHADESLVRSRVDAGFRMITVGYDHRLVANGITSSLAAARAAIGSRSEGCHP